MDYRDFPLVSYVERQIQHQLLSRKNNMKTGTDLFSQSTIRRVAKSHEPYNECRPIDPTGAGNFSLQGARLQSKKGQDLSMRQETTGHHFQHEYAKFNGSDAEE